MLTAVEVCAMQQPEVDLLPAIAIPFAIMMMLCLDASIMMMLCQSEEPQTLFFLVAPP